MSNAKHTPGPWKIDGAKMMNWCRLCKRQDVELGLVITASHGTRVCRVGPRATKSTAKDDANARLIAAAPDLLAAVEAAKKLFADILDNMPYIYGNNGSGPADAEATAWRNKIIDDGKLMLRAAIAKAKGE